MAKDTRSVRQIRDDAYGSFYLSTAKLGRMPRRSKHSSVPLTINVRYRDLNRARILIEEQRVDPREVLIDVLDGMDGLNRAEMQLVFDKPRTYVQI